jgi:3',5'-cyclic AMP phosphodiesterase CpdA
MTFRLAHVTDPHFRSFDGARLGDFMGKRAVGALNLVVNRRRKHKMELLEAMAADLRQGEPDRPDGPDRPDHLVLTGDLSNVSLEAEWREALRWIESTGRGPEAVTVIPGNHDAYVPEVVARHAFEALFGAYQSPDLRVAGGEDAGAEPGGDRAAYPFVRFRGPLALVAVNSCVPTGDLGAWGQIGAAQLGRLEATLGRAEVRGRVRVVLIHHPPVKLKGGEERNLKDREALGDVLARAGADLVLHGHDHRDETATLPGPGGAPIPVVGAGSASYAGGPETRARYNVYEFEGSQVTRVTRVHDEATDTFREAARDVLRS